LTKPHRVTKTTRCFRSINIPNFSSDILSSSLFTSIPVSLESYIKLFNSTLSTILDKHAPLKTVTCPSRPNKPFITPEILTEKSIRSKLESIYRRNKTPETRADFKRQSSHLAKLVTAAKRSFFRNAISTASRQPKKLWSLLDSLLSRHSPCVLPNSLSPISLANSFLDFFNQKISKLTSSFVLNLSSPHFSSTISPPSCPSFAPATIQEVKRAILSSSNASCSLDIIPTFLLKSCLDTLVYPITTIINLALTEGIFPDSFKIASVTPLLKKHNLPSDDLSSYRPISNLNFISKILERIIHSRMNSHLHSFPSICRFQSAYRKYHSTETALLRIHNDLLLASNQQKVSASHGTRITIREQLQTVVHAP
jgi:hypothetical protein